MRTAMARDLQGWPASPFWPRGDGLMREHVAILRLSARTHGEHDAEARAFESRFVPMIFFDQGKREVNAGGGTCRCLEGAR